MGKDIEIVAFTPRVKRVFDHVLNEGGYRVFDQPHRIGRSSLDAHGVGGSQRNVGYNGAFKIIISGIDGFGSMKVKIVDYPSFIATGKSEKMPCKVNGKMYWVEPFEAPLDKSMSFWLWYGIYEKELEIVTGDYDAQPTDNADEAYYLIGRVQLQLNSSPVVQQAHVTGAANFYHIFRCYNNDY